MARWNIDDIRDGVTASPDPDSSSVQNREDSASGSYRAPQGARAGYGSTAGTNAAVPYRSSEKAVPRVCSKTVTFWKRASKRFRRRFFKGKGVFLVLLLVIFVNFGFYFTTAAIVLFLNEALNMSTSAVSTLQRSMWSSFEIVYPFSGFIADVYLGRNSVIRWSMLIMWGALAALSMSVGVSEGGYLSTTAMLVVPIPALVALLIALGGFKANIIPFGIDQLEGASSEQISLYISWYYCSINIGSLLGFVTLSLIGQIPAYISLTVATAILTVALCVHLIFNNVFDKTRESRNPLGLVVRIISYAATAQRGPPRRRRAFRYGEIPPSRIDLAKVDYDGKFTHEQVEDVKTFCLILLVCVSLAGALVTYGGLFTMITHEVFIIPKCNVTENQILFNVQQNLSTMVNAGTIIVFIPLFNNFLFPLLGNYTPNLRKRIAIGILFEIGAGVLCVVIESIDRLSIPQLIVLPMVPLAIAEILILVTGIEFVCAQSPYAMKGTLIGLFFCTFGICNAIAAALFTTAPDSKTLCFQSAAVSSNCVLWYFVFYTVVAGIGFVVYVFTALVYRNRSRDVVVNYNAIVEEYYDKSKIESSVSYSDYS